MALTRASVEYLLQRRCGRRLAFVSLDGTTVNGSNPDFADPIRAGLASLGLTCLDPTNPATADLAAVDVATQLDQLLDVAELRCLQTIYGNLDEVSEQVGQDKKDFGQWGDSLLKAINALTKAIMDQYGVGLSAPSVGVIGLNFAESGDPADWEVTS